MTDNRYILMSGILLGLFAVIGTGLVGLTYEGTAERIANNERLALLQKLNQILPRSSYDNDLIKTTLTVPATRELGQKKPSTVYIAKQQGQVSAMIFSVTSPRGYSGDINMLVGIKMNGRLAGVRIVSHKETPGLGDAIETERSDWVLGFADKSLTNPDSKGWKVKRDGGQFDQFTGATITPRAVVNAVYLSLVYFEQHKQALLNQYQQNQALTPAKDN